MYNTPQKRISIYGMCLLDFTLFHIEIRMTCIQLWKPHIKTIKYCIFHFWLKSDSNIEELNVGLTWENSIEYSTLIQQSMYS